MIKSVAHREWLPWNLFFLYWCSLGLDPLTKFLEWNSLVATEVKSSNDRDEFFSVRVVANFLQKASQRSGVYVLQSWLVDRFETMSCTEAWGLYKFLFLLLNTSVEIYLGANKVSKMALYLLWKVFTLSSSFVWSLGNRRSNCRRIAR